MKALGLPSLFVLLQTRSVSGSEPLAIFKRVNERLNHFGLDEVAVKGVQLIQPEVKAGGIRIAAEIAEVFHCDEGAVELVGGELLGLGNRPQYLRARESSRSKAGDERIPEGILCRDIAAN